MADGNLCVDGGGTHPASVLAISTGHGGGTHSAAVAGDANVIEGSPRSDQDPHDNDAYGNPLMRAPQEELKYNTLVCFLPRLKSDNDMETWRRYAGCIGVVQTSYQRQDGTWETHFEIRAILNPWTHDRWIRHHYGQRSIEPCRPKFNTCPVRRKLLANHWQLSVCGCIRKSCSAWD